MIYIVPRTIYIYIVQACSGLFMSGFMRGIDNKTIAIKRNCSRMSQSSVGLVPASACDNSKRSKSKKRPKFRNNTSIDDLPDGVLVEIFCRLACNKFVFRCTSVSKRWYTLVSYLISDPCFIDRFVRLQSDRKIPTIRTLLNDKAEELFLELPFKPLSSLFERLMSCHSLESEPVVVATCDDLVLCSTSKDYQSDYFICNPYTIQWVPLPPPPRVYEHVAVGFICDVDNAQQSCRCKVVRIPGEINQQEEDSSNLNVEIFSSETGKWRESIVSFTQEIECGYLMSNSISHPYNGMLYWELEEPNGNIIFIGFDPFMINTSSSDGNDHYKGRIIDFGEAPNSVLFDDIVCVGVCGGCLRFIGDGFDMVSCTLLVWELEEEQDKRVVDRSGKLILKCTTYSLDTKMFDGTDRRSYLCQIFDPNDEDILYLGDNDVGNFKCNIRTREWSNMPALMSVHNVSFLFQLITLPWWPTTVPRLPEDQPPHGEAKKKGSKNKQSCVRR